MKLSRNDRIMAITAMAMISLFSLLLAAEYTASVTATGERIGTIIMTRKVAERKYTRQVLWNPVREAEPVFAGDMIRTDDVSRAVIRLEDGSEIELDENSMVLLSLTRDAVAVDLAAGSVAARREVDGAGAGRPLTVRSRDARIALNEGRIHVAADDKDRVTVQSERGDAVLRGRWGSTPLRGGQVGRIDTAAQRVEVKSCDRFPLGPSPNRQVVTCDGAGVRFSWEGADTGPTRLEVSRDRGFRSIVVSEVREGRDGTLALAPGTYYWRVRREGGGSGTCVVRKLTVFRDEPVVLLAPEDRKAVTFRDAAPVLDFAWRAHPFSSKYILEIARDESFAAIVKRVETPGTGITIDDIGEGTYYWRVRSRSSHRTGPCPWAGPPRSLVIMKASSFSPPEPVNPAEGRVISRETAGKESLLFTWKPVSGDFESTITLASDPDFKNVIMTGRTRYNFYRTRIDLAPGNYYWKVAAAPGDGKTVSESLTRVFTVAETDTFRLLGPRDSMRAEVPHETAAGTVKFSWNNPLVRGKVRFQLSSSRSFSSPVTRIIDGGQSVSVSGIGPGRYYWRVSLLNDDLSEIVSTEARRIFVARALGTPRPASPANHSDVNMDNRDSIELCWDGVDGADRYRVTLYRISDAGPSRIDSAVTKGTCYRIASLNRLDRGRFSWSVRALETDGGTRVIRQGSPAESYFTISLGRSVEKPRVTSVTIAE